MGILIADSVVLDDGLTLSGFVLSIGGSLSVVKSISPKDLGATYKLSFTIRYSANQDAYSAGKVFRLEDRTVSIDPSLIGTDLFSWVYNGLKQPFNQTTDI